jgi:hypothetical protein
MIGYTQNICQIWVNWGKAFSGKNVFWEKFSLTNPQVNQENLFSGEKDLEPFTFTDQTHS